MNYHFIGIKGSGMSALAQILFDRGHIVQGSDVETHYFTQVPLEKRNISILPFHPSNIKQDFTIIAGNAFKEDNVEIAHCIKENIPFIRYHEFLSQLISEHISVGISGAHGKTSTTGLLSHTFKQLTPTSFLIGDGTGSGIADSQYFMFEACEYRRHFLSYHPDYAIITNIDFDHPDYFHSLEDVVQAFDSFAKQAKKGVVMFGDSDTCRHIQPHVPTLFYGFGSHNDLIAQNIRNDVTQTSFDVVYHDHLLGTYHIPLFGKHNVLNALAVIGISLLEEIDQSLIRLYMQSYGGVKRRFSETFLETNVVIDDYAHHPIEIKATLDAARSKYPDKEIVAIFQPHTFSRTQQFLQEFADSLKQADRVFLCDIFGSARENNGSLTIHDLINMIPDSSHIHQESVDQLHSFTNSVLLFMGAGDIQKIEAAYKQSIQTRA